MGQSVLAFLDVAHPICDPLDGRYAFRSFTHRCVWRGFGSVLDLVHFAGESDHQVQRPKLKAGSRSRWRSEKQGVLLDLCPGDSAVLRASVDRAGDVRCDRHDLVYSRPAH